MLVTLTCGEEAVETININQSPQYLTVSEFDEKVVDKTTNKLHDGSKPWFIKFFAPWCGHCKKLAPVWDEFHQKHGNEINIAKVDCTSNEAKPLCNQFEIRGYPSLLFLKEDKAYTFRKPRKLEEFVEYAQGGYANADDEHIKKIPKRVEGMEKFKKETVSMIQ